MGRAAAHMTTRRSFLALLAAALAVKPETLTAPLAHKQNVDAPLNSIIEGWADSLHWVISDDLVIAPGCAINESLFASPIPANFAIHSLGWGAQPSILLADFRQILDLVACQLTLDGRAMAAGPLWWFSEQRGLSSGSARILPALMPTGDFKLDVAGDPLTLSAPTKLTFWLDGVITMKKERG